MLFIDARDKGHLVSRKLRDFSEEDIASISEVYHKWRKGDDSYEDVPGFCKSANIEEVKALDYILTPGRYVGLAEEEDDFVFEEKFEELKRTLIGQLEQEKDLNAQIKLNLNQIKS